MTFWLMLSGNNGHEARFSSLLIIIWAGIMGVIDALAPDADVKFIASSVLLPLFLSAIAYELIWLETPKHPEILSMSLSLVMFGSFWGIWNIVWLFFRLITAQSIYTNGMIGIAPHIALTPTVWALTTAIGIIITIIGHLLVEKYGV